MELIGSGVELARRESIPIEEAARRIVDDAVANKKRLPGLGHRVHSTDPRKAILFKLAAEAGMTGNGIAFMEALEKAAGEAIKPLPMNIDGALAGVLYDLGFPPLFGKLIFIMGRVAGLTAEVAEEYAREKAMRIRIPVTYDGVPPRQIEH
jgi:citrate synthase